MKINKQLKKVAKMSIRKYALIVDMFINDIFLTKGY